MTKNLFALSGLFLMLAWAASDARAQCTEATAVPACGNEEFTDCTIDVGGVDRQFCLHVPRQLPAPAAGHPRPVVFVFHGGGGSAVEGVALVDHLTEQDIIFIVPSALETEIVVFGNPGCSPLWRFLAREIDTWADFGVANGCGPAGASNAHDLELVEALLDEADARYEVLGHYALGFSNGAGMALQLMITDPLADRFSGFGLIANGISHEMGAGLTSPGVAPWFPNAEPRIPVMLIWGTADKFAFPWQTVIESIEAWIGSGDCPSNPSVSDVIECYMVFPTAPAPDRFDYYSRIDETALSLLLLNNALPRAVESVYPDKGLGGSDPLQQDITIGVRQDYLAVGQDSAPVSVIRVVGGGHVVPGKLGAHPPCASRNCDFRGIDEILDFWRAHAGFETLWR